MPLVKPTVGQTTWGATLNTALDYLNTKVGPWTSVPAHNTSAGTAGQVAYDSSYIYVCVATNSWKRIAWTSGSW